jgi:GNAT superfamily N-acetyltransferase
VAGAGLDVPFRVTRGADEIDASRERLDVAAIHAFLTDSYWSPGIPRATVERAIEGSLNFGLYRELHGKSVQIGFARVVTDGATFAYVADVFVLPDFRGAGLATWLVTTALTHPALRGLRRVLLATKDAHPVYARCGFVPLARPERFMEINHPNVYRAGSG